MGKDVKIATLTFHRAINYGAILQTYALQDRIHALGYASEVLDYRCDFLERLHNPYSMKLYRTPLHFLYALYRNRVKRDNRAAFRRFMSEHISVSSKVYDQHNLTDAENEYDAFVVGSDQVWNCNCTNFDKTYFLDFIEDANKKLSYAASIGIKLETEEQKNEYKRLLSHYRAINVREEQGRRELAAIGLEADVTLDPTLLLDKQEWLRLAKKPDRFDANTRYLLVYVIVETPSLFEKAKAIAKEHKLEIVYINEMLLRKAGVKNLTRIAPEEWLWLFANAEFVVTNSFHGTAFSVNFEKQFVVEPLPVKTNVNSRIYDFLELLGLQNRVAEQLLLPLSPICYEEVDLEQHRAKSFDRLMESLHAAIGDQ